MSPANGRIENSIFTSMRYLFFVLLSISTNAFAQNKNSIYVQMVTQKITKPYHVDIYVEQCNTTNIKSMFVNPAKSPFYIPLELKCDSAKQVQLIFSIPANYPIDRSAYKGDLLFYNGDSILYNLDNASLTVLNKTRPGRPDKPYDCECHSTL